VLAELHVRMSNGFLATSSADDADAALKIAAERSSGRPGDLRVVVIVKAVNANGHLVWPDSRGSGSWKYVGRPNLVAERIANDMTKAVRK